MKYVLLLLILICVLIIGYFNDVNQQEIINNQEVIILKQDTIIDINQAFRTYHLRKCAFKQIDHE